MKKIIKTKILLTFLLFINSITLISAATRYSTDPEECVDGVCYVPQQDEDGNQVYAVVSPIGYHDVEMITQVPRLSSLDGKTFALVGGSFMAVTTHNEIKKCIEKEFPDSKVYMFEDIGTAGPFSVAGTTSKTKAFQEKLKELKIDAVITGNCGCGLCTTKETGNSIAAEYIGIPSVTIAGPTFTAQVHSTGVNRGVPVLRTAEYPGAFAADSREILQKNAREILWPQIKKALTENITQLEIAQYAPEGKRPYDEIIYYGSYEEIQEFFKINNWTDGLPVIPPTDEKISEYLKYTPFNASDVIGTIAVGYRECTVYTVAANAVMSGVPAEFMPMCIAFAQIMNNGEWRKPLSSTHGWTPFAWLNGPLARQLGIDCQQGMISEANNKALGRFIDLCMMNLGGYYVKENRMGTFGYLTPFTFSEDDKACVELGWKPYHVTQGYNLNANTITAGSVLNWGNNVTSATTDAEKIKDIIAFDITEKQQNGLGNTNPQVYRTLFITEFVARDLAEKYKTKESLEDALIETARRPLNLRAYALYWANTGSQQYNRRSFEEELEMLRKDKNEKVAITPTPDWYKPFISEEEIETIACMNKGETAILVTGDPNRNKIQTMPGGGFVTSEIKLPENWNDLTAVLGYEPIENFYIEREYRVGETNTEKKSGNAQKRPSRPVKPARPAKNKSIN